MHCLVKNCNKAWFFPCTQGPLYPTENHIFWDNLSTLGKKYKGPWMTVDDFNERLEKHENLGGKKFNPRKAKFTLEFMGNMHMIDFGSIGPTFTWVY